MPNSPTTTPPPIENFDPRPSTPIADRQRKARRLAATGPAGVRIVAIDMPFWNMVWFMVKWTLASIPAFMILAVIGFVFFWALGGALMGIVQVIPAVAL